MKLKDLIISEFNVREQTETDAGLAESVKSNGLYNKIVLRVTEKGTEILCGSRRYKALLETNGPEYDLPEDAYIIKDGIQDKEALRLALEENQHRKNLSPIELSKAALLLNHANFKDKEIATILNISPHRLKRIYTLVDDKSRIPENANVELKKPIEVSKFTDAHWDKVRVVEDDSIIKDVVDKIMEKEIAPRDVPAIVKGYKAPPVPKEEEEATPGAPPVEGPLEYSHKGELVMEMTDGKSSFKVLGKGEDEVVPMEHYLEYLKHPEKFKCYVSFKMKIKPVE